jgi:hypothetical protein
MKLIRSDGKADLIKSQVGPLTESIPVPEMRLGRLRDGWVQFAFDWWLNLLPLNRDETSEPARTKSYFRLISWFKLVWAGTNREPENRLTSDKDLSTLLLSY